MKSPAVYQYGSPKIQRRAFLALTAGAIFSVATYRGQALAAGTYAEAEKIDSSPYTFKWGTYTTVADGTLYQYANGAEGDAYYNTYDGTAWSGWEGYETQPTKVAYDPAPATYEGKNYAFYTGDDGYVYHQSWDTYGEAVWEDVSGEYTYSGAPYANVADDGLHLYANGADGYVYHKTYTADGWGTWAAINDTYTSKKEFKPYAVSWGEHENAFWCDEAGKVYWNRYDYATQEWTGAKEIPGDYTYDYAPYAIGYAPEESLYAYAVSADGVPTYNVFDGTGWSGWEAWDVTWKGAYQPNAYYYQDYQHVAYTADDGTAYYIEYGADGWSEWQDLGGNYGYDTWQYEYNDGLYLTYTGQDGGIYYKTYDGGGTVEPTEEPY